jgi:plasmid maintenance system antidote protein VapI
MNSVIKRPALKKPEPPKHPGIVLKDVMKELNINSSMLVGKELISGSLLSHILSGNRRITAKTAITLSEYFAKRSIPNDVTLPGPITTARYWMDLQRDFDIWEELESRSKMKRAS